tara:strand:- start:1645 stop:1938 length:294 start_codon:yes stop_codon:yes gene_type:complete
MIIFIIGYVIMVLNEGFVMMRHVSPLFAQIREELIKDFGSTWTKIHSTLDWLWIVFVGVGLWISVGHRVLELWLLGVFWGGALLLIYVPKWLRKQSV